MSYPYHYTNLCPHKHTHTHTHHALWGHVNNFYTVKTVFLSPYPKTTPHTKLSQDFT